MKRKIFYLLTVIVCVVSITLTIVFLNFVHINIEDKTLISSINQSKEQCERNYTYSRVYVLKDGTVINGAGGSGSGKHKK